MKKVPIINQLEELECGAACMGMILGYHGKWLTLEQLRTDCGVSRDGSKASSLVKAARNYGMDAKGYSLGAEDIWDLDDSMFPCIAHWENKHFVVLCGYKGNNIYINDPAIGNLKMSFEEFHDGFSGVIITMTPGEGFQPEGRRPSMWRYAAKRLKEHPKAVAITVVCNIASAVLSAAGTMLAEDYIDAVLPGQEGLGHFILFLLLFNILQIVFLAAETIVKLKDASAIASKGASDFMWKVIKLPMEFFSQRSAGDVNRRREENSEITETFLDCLGPLAIDAFMMIFYFVMMIRYAPFLTLVAVALQGLGVWFCTIATEKTSNIRRLITIEDAKLYSFCVSGIEMVSTIKATGSEKAYIKKWHHMSVVLGDAQKKELQINATWGQLPGLIDQLSTILILVAGIFLVGEGKMTLGILMVFQSFFESFAEPIGSFLDASKILQETRTQMERVDDVLHYPKDKVFDFNIKSEEYEKLKGNISLKDVTFRYNPLSDPVIDNLSIDINKGDSIAFVGYSGCGKSTVSKLISGLCKPESGEVRFDGQLLHDIDPVLFRASLAVVDQDITLFDDTVANNIKMWDEYIEDFEMILAAKDAQIHDDIMRRPEGYNTLIKDNGGNFSGGQCQRIEIARVLAQDPSIVIFDEATSALDAETESKIVQNIKDRGITSIVIAHRLSAIRNCNRIVVLDKGKILAEGTHRELFQNCELYRQLVSNE